MDKGQAAAFTGTLDRPPTSSWEIMNPREYEIRHVPAVPLMPDIHPLVDKLYQPYDIGQVGQLDLHILAEIFGGEAAARDLTPAWDGGLYWAGQQRSAKTKAEQASTKSLALFYLSIWRNKASAEAFAQLYADELGRKYSGVKVDEAAESATPANLPSGSEEQVFSTNEGPVVITTRGKMVFVAESFPLELARKLTALILDVQGTGEMKMAQAPPLRAPSLRLSFEEKTGARVGDQEAGSPNAPGLGALEPLTANLIRFFANCGVMKAPVDAAVQAAK
jgi:hypothetical protein